jgi:hypothetical protein
LKGLPGAAKEDISNLEGLTMGSKGGEGDISNLEGLTRGSTGGYIKP